MSTAGNARRKNRLAEETSPYLLQHAENPVDWSPWGAEALERARRENKPILLSIGYAACHWCHVMERESFENDDIAKVMNEHFVSIKVDREERPDLDDIYMAATVALSGHGGWPMTVFLTPDQRPFFAGTYFPPTDKYGRPGFGTLLDRIAGLWENDRDSLAEQAAELTEHVARQSAMSRASGVSDDALDRACADLSRSFDPKYGGFGEAPKFPPSEQLRLLLRRHRLTGDEGLLRMARTTLDGMKNGGMYDHVGGGFARYSTDERWLVPHFEKMLYDNAQLARTFLEAFQVTRSAEYERVVRETLDYVAREMQSDDGGYFSATDADSEGEEGKFFVWTPEQIDTILPEPQAAWFCAYYDITPHGNWEGVSIPNTPRSMAEVAKDLGIGSDDLVESIAKSRKAVYDARRERIPPLLDDKILTSWNGLMIGAMADAARVLRHARPDDGARYLDSATRAACHALETMRRPDGGLYRTARHGRAHLDGYLEDYAYLVEALIDLYEATTSPAVASQRTFLEEAETLADRMIRDFAEPDGGAFFQTAHDHESLIVRTREGHDGAIPNANGVAVRALLRLAVHLDRSDLRTRAEQAIAAYGRSIERAPRAFASTLGAVDFALEGPVELVLAGDPDAKGYAELERVIAETFLPNRVIARTKSGDGNDPLTSGKIPQNQKPALYVCRDFTCEAPVIDPDAARAALERAASEARTQRAARLESSRLAGRATPAATRAYAKASGWDERSASFGELGSSGLVASRMGFGGYRIDDRAPEHRSALEKAITSGINLVDTSTNYGDGHSERLVGEVIGDVHRRDVVRREAIVVVTKAGYVQGDNFELAKNRKESGRPFPEMVEVGDGLWHCIHPEWLGDQIGRSLDRLGLETLDVCLLHNPEYFLKVEQKRGTSVEDARVAFYERMERAFSHLETEVERGRIASYGVSSNTCTAPADDPEATDLSKMLAAANAAACRTGRGAHRFRVLQLPLNLIESGAVFERNTANETRTVLDVAAERDVAVLVNRPLNAIVEGGLLRLADPKPLDDAPAFAEQLARVQNLEEQFASTIAPSLQTEAGSGLDPRGLLRWATQIGDLSLQIGSLEEWSDIEGRAIAPRVSSILNALDRGLSESPMAPTWSAFRQEYVPAFDGLLRAARQRARARSVARAKAVHGAVDPKLSAAAREKPLSQKALGAIASLEGVSTVLVGARSEDYVTDVLAALEADPIENAVAVFEAVRDADLAGV